MANEGLAKYRPVPKAAPHGLENYAAAQELLAQAEALRGDFPIREAKLRQAADLFEDASARADALFATLDEKKRSAERAADAATQARAQTKELLATVEVKHADLLTAISTAGGVKNDAAELRQQQHRFGADLDAARLDLETFLQDMEETRAEVHQLKAFSRPLQGHEPGSSPSLTPGATPGAYTAVPALYPAGQTVLGFLYGLITDSVTGGLQLTGGTMTGELDINLTSGPSFAFTPTAAVRSGAFGLVFDKAKALNTNPHSIIWEVGGSPTWEVGQDFDTNNSDHSGAGNSDFITVYDHTANALAGADIMRFSPAEKDSVGAPGSTKMVYSGTGAGTPRTNTMLWQVVAGAGLSGMSLSINSASARDHLILINGHATSKRAVIDFNGAWFLGSDMAGTNTLNMTLRDKTNSLNRAYFENTASLLAKFGWNTAAPAGYIHSGSTADATFINVPQPLIAAGGGSLANRCFNVTQIIDTSSFPVTTQVWLSGTLGSTSTPAVPTSTSTNDKGCGLLYDGDIGKLFVAPAGTNQVVSPVFSYRWSTGSSSPQISWFGATAVVKQAGASAAGIAAIADAPAKAAILALQTALAAYALVTAPA